MSRPNFPLAFPLAIAAGAAAAFVVSLLMIPVMGADREKTFAGAMTAASLIAWYAAFICAVYTILIGIGVVVYVKNTGRVPSLRTALIIAIVTGVLPWVIAAIMQGNRSKFDVIMMPVLALGAALAAAWTFWRVGLRGRIEA